MLVVFCKISRNHEEGLEAEDFYFDQTYLLGLLGLSGEELAKVTK